MWPSPDPGRLPLDAGRGDVESASVFVSVAFVAVSNVSQFIFGNLVEIQIKELARTRPGKHHKPINLIKTLIRSNRL